jgi:hypothetical protein
MLGEQYIPAELEAVPPPPLLILVEYGLDAIALAGGREGRVLGNVILLAVANPGPCVLPLDLIAAVAAERTAG